MSSINLLDDVGSFMGPETLNRFGTAVGESPTSTSRAATSAIPTLLGGLSRIGKTPGGASQLLDAIRNNGYADADAISRASAAPPEALGREGSALLSTIFGSRQEKVIDGLSGSTGVSKRSMGGLMAMLAPFVMSIIGRRVRAGDLDAEGLSSLLKSQEHHVRGLIPSGVADTLGIREPEVREVEEVETVAVRETEPRATEPRAGREPVHGGSKSRWLWPLLAIGALAAGLILLFSGLDRSGEEAAVQEGYREVTPTTTAQRTTGESYRAEEAERPPEAAATVDELARAIENPERDTPAAFSIDELQFDDGSSALRPEANEAIDRIASLMSENPDACLSLVGHASSTGARDVNERLSTERSTAIRNALIERGVAANRVDSTGRGEWSPVASNETRRGQRANRRTEVVVNECPA